MSLVSIPIFEPNFEAVDSHAGYLLALTSKQKIETENRCTYSLIAISSMDHLLQLNDITCTRKESGNGHCFIKIAE